MIPLVIGGVSPNVTLLLGEKVIEEEDSKTRERR
jgi:hypothetical protein